MNDAEERAERLRKSVGGLESAGWMLSSSTVPPGRTGGTVVVGKTAVAGAEESGGGAVTVLDRYADADAAGGLSTTARDDLEEENAPRMGEAKAAMDDIRLLDLEADRGSFGGVSVFLLLSVLTALTLSVRTRPLNGVVGGSSTLGSYIDDAPSSPPRLLSLNPSTFKPSSRAFLIKAIASLLIRSPGPAPELPPWSTRMLLGSEVMIRVEVNIALRCDGAPLSGSRVWWVESEEAAWEYMDGVREVACDAATDSIE